MIVFLFFSVVWCATTTLDDDERDNLYDVLVGRSAQPIHIFRSILPAYFGDATK